MTQVGDRESTTPGIHSDIDLCSALSRFGVVNVEDLIEADDPSLLAMLLESLHLPDSVLASVVRRCAAKHLLKYGTEGQRLATRAMQLVGDRSS